MRAERSDSLSGTAGLAEPSSDAGTGATGLRYAGNVLLEHGLPRESSNQGPMLAPGYQRILRCLDVEVRRVLGGLHPSGQVRLSLQTGRPVCGPETWTVWWEVLGLDAEPSRTDVVHDSFWAKALHLAQSLGGSVFVEGAGRLDPGLVVWARLPMSLPVIHSPVVPDRGLQGLRVLVVDDNRVNLAVLEGLLRRWGCRVELAEDGHQATLALVRRRYDLVLMDLQMPVMDGFAATRWIRAQAAPLCDLPVVAVSANSMPADRQRSKEAGVDALVAKPVHADRLEQLIRKMVKNRA